MPPRARPAAQQQAPAVSMAEAAGLSDCLFAIFKLAALAERRPCVAADMCPGVEGSQAFNLYRSVIYVLSVLPPNDLVELVGALFNGPGAELCRGRGCGNAECAFANVDWSSSDSGGVKLVELLQTARMQLQRDATYAITYRREVVNPHRRAVAAFISLLEPGHVYASVLKEEGVCVQLPASLQIGRQRMPVVSVDTACATSVTASRFYDFNDMTKAALPLPAASGVSFKPYFTELARGEGAAAGDEDAAPDEAEAAEPAARAVAAPHIKDLYADLPALGGLFELCMRLRRSSFMLEEPCPGMVCPADQLFFAPCKPSPGHTDWMNDPVTGVKYDPGAGTATSCGGGQAAVGRLVGIAKQLHGTHYGDLCLTSSGVCLGWDQLPTLDYAAAVHKENAGQRPYNGYTGPKALEKAWEFGLPCVTPESPGEVAMTPHESETHAHVLVVHLAQLCQPKLLLQFDWPGELPVCSTPWKTRCKQIMELAQVIGTSLASALLRFNAIPGAERRKALGAAFSLLGESTTASMYDRVFAAGLAVAEVVPPRVMQKKDASSWAFAEREKSVLAEAAEETRRLRSQASGAVLVAGLAMAIDPSIAGAWDEELSRYEALVTERSCTMEQLVKNRCEQGGGRARAAGILFGLWVDADAHNRPRRKLRTPAPFSHAEIAAVGAIDLTLATKSDARIGFLRPPVMTASSLLVVLAGHTSVSLTEGHLVILEMAARHILRAPGLRVSPASRAKEWPDCFPSNEERKLPHLASVKRGVVVANQLFHNSDAGSRNRKLVGLLELGGGERFFYRSVRVERTGEDEKPSRKRSLGEACCEVDIECCQFAPVYGADYSRRFTEPLGALHGVAALDAGDEVIVTSYLRQNPDWPCDQTRREEVAHIILVGRGRPVEGGAVAVMDGSLAEAGFVPAEAHRSAEDGERLANQGIAGRAVAVLYTLSSEEGYVNEPLRAALSWTAWPIQKKTRSNVLACFMGQQGCGKSTLVVFLDVIYGDNMLRIVNRMEKEIDKQFGEETTNSIVIWGDEVSDAFIDKVLESNEMKEAITTAKSRAERKHENGRVKSDNHANFAACSNHMQQVVKEARRLIRLLCSGGLRVKLHGPPASDYFDAVHRDVISSPWGNAGILHFLCNYTIPDKLEMFTVGSNSGTWCDAVLLPQPSHRLHKFLKWLVELPLSVVDASRPDYFQLHMCAAASRAEFLGVSTVGWGEKLCLSHAEFMTIVRVWFEYGVSRKERGQDKDINAEVTIERQFREETGKVRTLMEMNKAAKVGTYELTRGGLRQFLQKDHGLEVVAAAPAPFYELPRVY